MQRVHILLQKLTELSEKNEIGVIDTDLMLDYTRVLYADLLEARKNAATIIAPDNLHAQDSEQVNESIEKKENELDLPAAQFTQAAPLYDIRTLIGINDKYLFITELFKDDKAAYDEAIKHINSFNSADEAIDWTQQELERKYNWDKEHETTQSFYSLLNRCFSSM